MNLRTVPDTNVAIASKLTNSETSPNYEYFVRWQRGEFELLYSRDTLHEYVEKLLEKGVSREEVKEFVKKLARSAEKIYIEFFHYYKYPTDDEDIMFVLCADNGKATHLITYDPHLLNVDHNYLFKICNTVPFLKELRELLGEKE